MCVWLFLDNQSTSPQLLLSKINLVKNFLMMILIELSKKF